MVKEIKKEFEIINGKEMWKYFFENPKKNYNQYMYEMIKYPNYLMFDNEKVDTYKGKWNEFFKNENDIFLEIGCGSGNFTVQNAEKFKDRNYIALELRFKRLVMGARKSEKRDLNNILFLRKRGETILDFLAPKELFSKLDVILKDNGKLYFKTDHKKYYEDVLELVQNELENYEVIYNTDDLHNSEKALDNIKTEFEQMFLSKHKMNIKYIEIVKK